MSKRKVPFQLKYQQRIPVLPNFITTIGLFFGFYSMLYSLKGDFYHAAMMIFFAAFIDGIDGRVARATNSTSAFGKEYDSLADVIGFGVAPALLMYHWHLHAYGRFGFLFCFIFMACGALRLARFNTEPPSDGNRFTGLPIPAGATCIASFALLSHEIGPIPNIPLWSGFIIDPLLISTFILAFLMVSTIPYPSFKQVNYVKAHPFQLLVAGIFLLVIIAMAPEIMAFILTTSFAACGLLHCIGRALLHMKKKALTEMEHNKITDENHSA